MTARAKRCEECKFWKWVPWTSFDGLSHGWIPVEGCGKGHHPRFYNPRHEGDAEWGWRRRCSDFKPKEDR